MLAATLDVSLLGNLLSGKRVVRGSDGVIGANEVIIKADERQDYKRCFIL